MLVAIAVTLIYVEIKNSVLKSTFTEIATKFWNIWELRIVVVSSLILQILLVISGKIRAQYIGKKVPCIAIGVWMVYLSADWMATLVLSTLLRGHFELKKDLIVFWTPFLLWHLGSPDNITAYSLADNELWLRHFLALVLQVAEAIYIYWIYRSYTALNFMATPIFLAGFFKYGERIWALRTASDRQLINSLHYDEMLGELEEHIRTGLPVSAIQQFKTPGFVSEVDIFREAYLSFIIFKPLFSDLTFSLSKEFHEDMVNRTWKLKEVEEAFRVAGVELRFLYDMLFTKMSVLHRHSKVILSLRGFCFLSAVSSLIAFSAIIDKNKHAPVDVGITYLLLVGAVSLDICSFLNHAFSTWAMIWLSNNVHKNRLYKLYSKVAASSSRLRSIPPKMVIKSVAQHDLIAYCVKARTGNFTAAIRIIDTGNVVQKFVHTQWQPIDHELKEFIYRHLQEKSSKCKDENFKPEFVSKLLDEKGDSVLQRFPDLDDEDWGSMGFTRRIFVWHVATGLVYYNDLDKHQGGVNSPLCRISKCLSDYMMYLAMVRPLMLPKGFNEVINNKTYKEAMNFFPQKMRKNEEDIRKKFVEGLINFNFDRGISRKVSVLLDGCKIAQLLQNLVIVDRWDDEEKWELIGQGWMDLMAYCASRCTWKEHLQQLRHGGELLTYVSFLMEHLGLTTKICKIQTVVSSSSFQLD